MEKFIVFDQDALLCCFLFRVGRDEKKDDDNAEEKLEQLEVVCLHRFYAIWSDSNYAGGSR